MCWREDSRKSFVPEAERDGLQEAHTLIASFGAMWPQRKSISMRVVCGLGRQLNSSRHANAHLFTHSIRARAVSRTGRAWPQTPARITRSSKQRKHKAIM